MPDLPPWLVLLLGLAGAFFVARLLLRLMSRWWVLIVGVVLLAAAVQSGTLTNLLP